MFKSTFVLLFCIAPLVAAAQRSGDSIVAVNSIDTFADTNKLYLQNDFAFGGTFGTPLGFSCIMEKYIGDYGVMVELGVYPFAPSSFGEGVALLRNVMRTKRTAMDIGLYGFVTNPYFFLPEENMYAFGLDLRTSASGFFAELGAGGIDMPRSRRTVGLGVLFQIGYLR